MVSYARGSITRVEMFDFMTYDHVDVRFGPQLNLVVGPNGCGKSSILCALCIAFAGPLDTLNRQTKLQQLVKRGKHSAKIRVDIYDFDERSSPSIVCEVTANGKLEYSISDRPCSLADVKRLLASYNIQIGNLCQFIAQDNVVQFSRQTAAELLENTLNAVGSDELKRLWTLANKAYEEIVRLDSLEKNMQRRKAKLDRTVIELEPLADRFRTVTAKKDLLTQLKAKQQCLLFDSIRARYEEKSKVVERLQKQSCVVKNELKVKKVELQSKLDEMKKETSSFHKHHSSVASMVTALKALNATARGMREKAEQAACNRISLKEKVKNTERRIRNLEDTLAVLRSGLALREETSENVIRESSELRAELHSVRNSFNDSRVDLDRAVIRRDGVRNELERLRKSDLDRLNVLAKYDRKCVAAYHLLSKHKSDFQGPVYLPVLSIRFKRPEDAIFVENCVAQRDLLTFLFSHRPDMHKFAQLARDASCLPNIGLIPSGAGPQPIILDDQFKSFGLCNVVLDLFDAPEGVKKYLATLSSLHRICVGNERSETCLPAIIKFTLGKGLSNFFTPTMRVFSKRSAYTNRVTTRQIGLRRAKFFICDQQVNRLATLTSQLQEEERVVCKLEQSVGAWQKKVDELEEKYQQLKDVMVEADELKSQSEVVKMQEQSLRQYQERLSLLKASLKSGSEETEPLTKRRVESLTAAGEICATLLSPVKDVTVSYLKRMASWRGTLELERLVDSANRRVIELSDEWEEPRKHQQDVLKQLIHIKRELFTTFGRNPAAVTAENAMDKLEVPNAISVMPHSAEEIEEKIMELQFSLRNCRAQDEQVLRRLAQASDELKEVEGHLRQCLNDMTVARENFQKYKADWLSAVNSLTEKISKRFADFMQMLEYDGKVVLHQPAEPELPLSSIGLKILVAFRCGIALRELNDRFQSGGERSLSIIIYILALQEMTQLPFRCFDEINQGMDPTNERKLFTLILRLYRSQKHCLGAASSQCIMVTPKMLPNVDFESETNFVCVFNGIGALTQESLTDSVKSNSKTKRRHD